ncbi:MAG: glycerol acyltransferase [Deltaproteobacteria bacterium]|nr:MAG: glycerol acyltransferase [Deltaproteobacteria bacterium]
MVADFIIKYGEDILSSSIFNSSLRRFLLKPVSVAALKIMGWRRVGGIPEFPQAVVIGAYHTSNWDFVFTLLFAFDIGLPVRWMGKDSLFKRGFGGVMRWLGGIPIDRSRSKNVVEASIRELVAGSIKYLVIAPEGTRGRANRWKSGFYHIAIGAKVPIVMGFLDYKRKVGGLGPFIIPTNDMKADMAKIAEFYRTVTAKYPAKTTLP